MTKTISLSFSLHDMIEAGLHRITDRLEEIGSAAGKEFALETAMDKMKQVPGIWCFVNSRGRLGRGGQLLAFYSENVQLAEFESC